MTRPLRFLIAFLIAESETPEARDRRCAAVGRSSGETYRDTLRALVPDAECGLVRPAEESAALPDRAALEDYDAVFLTGSPLHVYQDTPEVRQQLGFMRQAELRNFIEHQTSAAADLGRGRGRAGP